MGEVIESYGSVKIMEGDDGGIPYYIFQMPDLTETEKRLLSEKKEFKDNDKKELLQVYNEILTIVENA